MLYVIVADHKPYRAEQVAAIMSRFGESEIISVDDATVSLADLEQFLYPSLFTTEVPIVHGRFFLSTSELEEQFAKALAASPTVFVFEELALPAPMQTMLKKSGATIHAGEKAKAKKPAADIFASTKAITAADKKSRWLAYRAAVKEQSIEAILGILYWKVRSLAAKEGPKGKHALLYRALLEAQARAWRTGAPLEALVEKVVIEF